MHELLDAGLEICIIFFDYSKAFALTTNAHPKMDHKQSYLYGRAQYVCVGGSSSGIHPVLSDIPQG